MSKVKPNGFRALIVALAWVFATQSFAAEQETDKPKRIVDDALVAFNHFVADPDLTWFRNHLPQARALLIVPTLVKAGFIVGGSGGTGVLLTRDAKTGEWSEPAFYTMGAGSVGLQIGLQASEVMLVVRTERGLNALLKTKVQLGAGVSVAAGPVGAGAEAATTDVLSFARSKGAFAGVSLEGAVITPREQLNQQYYGRVLTPTQILLRNAASNPHSLPLREALKKGHGG